ncbi:MAG TPA: ATP-binding protein [Xanthobacteraceae bacterium]|nr:ATP-binding protein [Xanthobacteraceae bacterium]
MSSDKDLSFLAGGGEMGAMMRAMDWSRTAIGPVALWPQSLRTAVGIMLSSRYAMFVWWGRELTNLYNDAYRPFLGTKHPRSLGQSARDVWAEIWRLIGPRTQAVLDRGESTFDEALLLIMERFGYPEETYFTFSYSPIRDDGGEVGGLFCAVTDETQRVIGERRLRLLREVASTASDTHTPEQVCAAAAECITRSPRDLPIVLLYLTEPQGTTARLVAQAGMEQASAAAEAVVDLTQCDPVWPLAEAAAANELIIVEDLASRMAPLPTGPWDRSPQRAVVVPLRERDQTGVSGFLVAGLNPYLVFDEEYRGFVGLLAGQISAGIAGARAYQQERKRADGLAEIDRAKTLFFSNVSHEFRTPLTLMLGPLEDVLAAGNVPEPERARLETAHRNSIRLLKLVNSLLDFSRIEAGRAQTRYAPTDLATLTAEIASNFRSACERAGLKLEVDCRPLDEPAYVDRDMWEKVVLNLLSNAFKFTFAGGIAIHLRKKDGHAELSVSDTGVGIPPQELPRLFERFHRIEGQRSRTYEGSGIGLALVQELVKLHCGTIAAESVEGRGTTFTLAIPLGRSHLPQDRVGGEPVTSATALRADAFVGEAVRWLPDEPALLDAAIPATSRPVAPQLAGARIFVADDNSDMRAYVRGLLGQHCDVQTFADGQAALEAIRGRAPDLLLADVMMPRLDGFGLVRAVRGDPMLADLPIVLLSARAGEEAKVEGFAAGADDYLVKPFSARELIARVNANLNLAKLRRQTTADLQDMNRLQRIANLCLRTGDHLQECLQEILAAAIAVTRADKGTLHVLEAGSDCLEMAAQSGFAEPFHELSAQARAGEASIWGQVLQSFDRVVVGDLTQSDVLTGEPASDVWRDVGVRAVQATPLVGSAGKMLGIVSTYFVKPHQPSERELRFMDLLARQAADYLERRRDEESREQAETTRQLLLSELNHRVKNTLAIVQAIAQQTVRSAKDPADFASRFSGRIQSLARVHSLLTDSTWRGADLQELIRDQLLRGPVDETRLTAWGPAVHLEPQMAVHLAVMLHELGTNSVKYGALSAAKGWVTVHWTVAGDVLNLQWIERGGPRVSVSARRGFGTTLIERSAKSEGGEATQLFEPEGLTWKISMALPHSDARREIGGERTELIMPVPRQGNELRSSETAEPLAGFRFLVIEDESLIALDLVDTLESAGARVAPPVSTEKESLQAIETGDFDCALLDGNLHGHSVEGIAAALTRRNVPFVFVTGYGQAGLPAAFKHVPMLSKPVSVDQLLDTVTGMLSGASKVVQLRSRSQ